MKIGVFVGSFNPPHLGHIKIIKTLIKRKIVDKVYVIPTNNYWDKFDIIEKKLRIDMLKTIESKDIIIKDIEGDYTYQILEQLEKENEYKLIIGSDNLEKFHLWKNYEELLKYGLIIITRGKIKTNYNGELVELDLNISSTKVREFIKENKEIKHLVGTKIKKYIIERNLYGGKYV